MGQNDKVRSAGRMDKDEPLITEYGLDVLDRGGKPTAWMNPNYKGTSPEKKREFPRKTLYRGLLRM